MDLNTQKPPDDISSEDAQRAQQLREDVAMFFKVSASGVAEARLRLHLLQNASHYLVFVCRALGEYAAAGCVLSSSSVCLYALSHRTAADPALCAAVPAHRAIPRAW